jgi:hypothetical protein
VLGRDVCRPLPDEHHSFTNTTAYAAYRFFVTANGGAAQIQVAEIQLF